MNEPLKEHVKKYWNAASCGTEHSNKKKFWFFMLIELRKNGE
jgi:hypothetical protein